MVIVLHVHLTTVIGTVDGIMVMAINGDASEVAMVEQPDGHIEINYLHCEARNYTSLVFICA